MGMAVILSVVFGYLADKWRISCLLQIAFLTRMVGLFTFAYIEEASSGLTYLAVTGLNVGNQCCSVIVSPHSFMKYLNIDLHLAQQIVREGHSRDSNRIIQHIWGDWDYDHFFGGV